MIFVDRDIILYTANTYNLNSEVTFSTNVITNYVIKAHVPCGMQCRHSVLKDKESE